jgi:hypothetical protein
MLTALALPIRPGKITNRLIPPLAQLHELQTDPERHTNGLPWLYGELGVPAPQELTFLLRIYNRAGIPIIEGKSKVGIGQKYVTFSELHALGIEAYAHVSETERQHISQRIWARHVYGTIIFL